MENPIFFIKNYNYTFKSSYKSNNTPEALLCSYFRYYYTVFKVIQTTPLNHVEIAVTQSFVVYCIALLQYSWTNGIHLVTDNHSAVWREAILLHSPHHRSVALVCLHRSW